MLLKDNFDSFLNTFLVLLVVLNGVLGFLIYAQFIELNYHCTTLLFNLVSGDKTIDDITGVMQSSFGSFCLFLCFLFVSVTGTVYSSKVQHQALFRTFLLVVVIVALLELVILLFGLPVFAIVSLIVTLSLSFCIGAFSKRLNKILESYKIQEDTVAIKTNELNLSKLQLIKSDEIDRRVLAGDLHDQVLHGLKMVRQNFHKFLKEDTSTLAEQIDSDLANSMDEIREVMDSLSPGALENLGFSEAVEEVIRKGASPGEYRVRYRCDVDSSRFEKYSKVELTLIYRIVQESVNNIIKHSKATKVRCLISDREGRLHITLADNGVGFDIESFKSSSRGMQYMIQRASIINATIDWRPAEKGSGTVVDISIA